MKDSKRGVSLRELTPNDVTFTFELEPEDTPVRGNAMSSGDAEADRECEDEILARLDRGNLCAWCLVKVTATWKDWEGVTYLGCCSYDTEADIRAEWFEILKKDALRDLNGSLARQADKLSELAT
jgi:hypothetical protein